MANNATCKCCKDCTKRHVGCHSTCEQYLEYKAYNEELKRKIKVVRDEEDRHYSRITESIKRMRRGKK